MSRTLLDTTYSLDYSAGTCYARNTSPSGLPAPNTAQTVSLWAKYSSVPSTTRDLYSLYGSGNGGVQMAFRSSVMRVEKGGSSLLVSSAFAPSINTWHHYCYTFDGTNHIIYIDGLSKGTSTTAASSTVPTTLYIGAFNTINENWPGQLADIRVWNTNLSAGQVLALYQSNTIPASQVSAWLLREGSGLSTSDSIGTNTLTISNATFLADTPWRRATSGTRTVVTTRTLTGARTLA